jgi:hypothetical protein
VRPAIAYTEDNNTVFSDPSYQQQTFLQQPEFIGGYESIPSSQGMNSTQFDGAEAPFFHDQVSRV